MQFRIAATFTDSLAKLTGDEQKAAKTTAFDLQMDTSAPGLSFHRVDRVRRNALCHGAWQGFGDDGSVGLRHFRRGDEGPESLEKRLSVESLSSVRDATVELTADLVDILSAAGVRFPGTALPGAAITDYMSQDRD